MPTLADLFADERDPARRVERFEALQKSLGASVERGSKGHDRFAQGVGILDGSRSAHLAELAEKVQTISKGLSAEQATEVQETLADLMKAADDTSDPIAAGNIGHPSGANPGNLAPYNLETPAKQLVPRFTPLRNDLTRIKGKGTAREVRRIRGYTNTGMGGVPDQSPFFDSQSAQTAFGSLNLRRGSKIAYAMDIISTNYVEMSLSSDVTYRAQFQNLGFEDSRALDQMALLWSHLVGEEKALLYGRGSGTGYSGALAALTVGAQTAVSSPAGTWPATATPTLWVAANSGFGYGIAVSSATCTPGVTTDSVNIPITSAPAGALNYGVWSGSTAGAATFMGNYSAVNGVINVPGPVSGGAAGAPTADASASALAYDGFLTVLTGSNSGYVNTAGGSVSTNGDAPWQNMFAGLYASVYADPEETWVSAPERRSLSDFLRKSANGTAGYRINLTQGEAGDATVGSIVNGLVNESSPTGRVVDLRVHPYMPAGVSFCRQRVLPVPDSGIGDTSVVDCVQDYMSIAWPQIQFTYDLSTYWLGTLVHYAPMWSGAITGLTA